MANRSILCNTAMVLTFLITVPGTLARSRERVSLLNSVSGIRTDRLTSKQLRLWREIEQIAVAADKAGRPLHPRLYSLWQWAKGSGHTITIDMTEIWGSNAAGRTTLQEAGRSGRQQVAVLWLHVYAIDNARINTASRRPDGLLPFYKLGRIERYAEIVGHELAHAVLMLEKPEYARLCSEMRMEADRYLLSRRKTGNGLPDEAVTGQQQVRLRSMIAEIERPAEAAELEIWRELINGQRRGAGAGADMDPSWTAMLMVKSGGN